MDQVRATYLLVLMILYTMANIYAVMQGITEMKQLTKLTGLLSCGVLFIFYFTLGMWHMLKRKEARMMRWLVCKLKDHDWEIERVQLGNGRFVCLGTCPRCMSQFWMKGEVGEWKGVRIRTGYA